MYGDIKRTNTDGLFAQQAHAADIYNIGLATATETEQPTTGSKDSLWIEKHSKA